MKPINQLSILFLCVATIISSCTSQNLEVDVLIKGGKIIDGKNGAAFMGDIGLTADTISFIGKSDEFTVKAATVIDVTGLTVTPGFIDPHTHALGDLQSKKKNNNLKR